ncbi:MAG: hypothetical protein WDZ91_04835 [Paenibacillaceae bacterium]
MNVLWLLPDDSMQTSVVTESVQFLALLKMVDSISITGLGRLLFSNEIGG